MPISWGLLANLARSRPRRPRTQACGRTQPFFCDDRSSSASLIFAKGAVKSLTCERLHDSAAQRVDIANRPTASPATDRPTSRSNKNHGISEQPPTTPRPSQALQHRRLRLLRHAQHRLLHRGPRPPPRSRARLLRRDRAGDEQSAFTRGDPTGQFWRRRVERAATSIWEERERKWEQQGSGQGEELEWKQLWEEERE